MKLSRTNLIKGLAISTAAIFAAATIAPSVSAQTATPAPASAQTYQVNLSQLNRSNASGTATLTLTGNSLKVSIRATGLSANQAHATHIHVGGQAACPTPAADTDKDNYVSAKEAEATTGATRISLTTSGDTGAGSALAVDRMPKADGQGRLSYDRTFNVPSGTTAADMQRATIDIHGITSLFDNRGTYDGSKRSELSNQQPFELTVLAACGKLTTTPVGGSATGAGTSAGVESPALLAAGFAALIGAVAIGFVARKQFNGTSAN